MNLFLIGIASDGGADCAAASVAAHAVTDAVPLFRAWEHRQWDAPSGAVTAVSVTHPAALTSGVQYARFDEDVMAMFAGRPFRWTDGGEADGRETLDPGYYLRPAERWIDSLDGRCAAARYDDATRTLELYIDPVGTYAVFTTQVGATRWVSNNVGALRALSGDSPLDPLAVASFVARGHSLMGEPLWSSVRRLPIGKFFRFHADGREEALDLLSLGAVSEMFGAGFDAEGMAHDVVSTMGALADWPGRPSIVPVTGGRDSRAVLAAAIASGIEFDTLTMASPHERGYPHTPDVRLASKLCELAVRPHHVVLNTGDADIFNEPVAVAKAMALLSPGPVPLFDVISLPLVGRQGPHLQLMHNGMGGELARAKFGLGSSSDPAALVRGIYGQVVAPWPRTLVSAEGEQLIRRAMSDWVERALDAGTDPLEVPTHYYLHYTATKGTTMSGAHQYVEDATTPLLNRRLIRHQLGLSVHERARELYHMQILRQLAPQLIDVPFEGSTPPWPDFDRQWLRRYNRARSLAYKASGEVRRRAKQGVSRVAPGRQAVDPFLSVFPEVRDAVLDQRNHAAWEVLDAVRVERLLTRNPCTLDPRSRFQVWRLASLFMGYESSVMSNGDGPR